VTSAPSNPDSKERRRLLASPRFRLALGLFLANVLLGWPLVFLLAAVAVLLGAKWLGLVGGMIAYAASWIVLGIAVLIGGQEVVIHGRWLIRRWMEKRGS
jgi:hypothetical protein